MCNCRVQSFGDNLQVAILNDFIPVSMSGREEDLKIALHWLAGKENKSHSSLLGHSHCPVVREWCFAFSVMFCSMLYQMNHIKSVTNLTKASKRSDSLTHFISGILEVLQ